MPAIVATLQCLIATNPMRGAFFVIAYNVDFKNYKFPTASYTVILKFHIESIMFKIFFRKKQRTNILTYSLII